MLGHRDIMGQLLENQVLNEKHFIWQKQLKYCLLNLDDVSQDSDIVHPYRHRPHTSTSPALVVKYFDSQYPYSHEYI